MTALGRVLVGPQRHAVGRALRGAIVIPTLFAFAHVVIGNRQVALFAAFGAFALLVMVEFSGRRSTQVVAYAALALTGAVMIAIGTLCSGNPWVAASVTTVVGFLVLYSGVVNGYFAAAGNGAVLTLVLPVSLPGGVSDLPDRLAGWGLACAVGIPAAMFLLADQPTDRLRLAAADACVAVARLIEAAGLAGPKRPDALGEAPPVKRTAAGTIAEMRDIAVGTPFHRTGAAGTDRGLACLVNEIDWLFTLVQAAAATRDDTPAPMAQGENRRVGAQVVGVLQASADRLRRGNGVPDLEALERARSQMALTVLRRIDETSVARPEPEDRALLAAIEPALRMRALAFATASVAVSALRATGGAVSESGVGGSTPADSATREAVAGGIEARPVPSAAFVGQRAREGLAAAVRNFRPDSLWFRNCARGAVGLGVAVLVAHLAHLQHGFWVVLATLAVLRSNALRTSSTVVRAVAGTVVGVVAGGALMVAIGSHQVVLWAIFPVAVFFASYAAGRLSFGAGQAAFSLMVLILFNLIVPTGWQVGLVRLEDIAVGSAISLLVGILLWPQGVTTVLTHDLSAAYRSAIAYVTASVRRIAGVPGAEPLAAFAHPAIDAGHRLDEAFGHYLTDWGARPIPVADVGALVAGANQLRLAGHSLHHLAGAVDHRADAFGARDPAMVSYAEGIEAWYEDLCGALTSDDSIPPPAPVDPADETHRLACLRQAAADGGQSPAGHRLQLLWIHQVLDELRQLEAKLAEPAARVRQAARRGGRSQVLPRGFRSSS
ncbi:FUSC family protein [Actinopolymorpha sp. B17G11]|uniref:FUSC family protein n=1 Tax=Actinopolymorpha sp. B17G11 TaxID=3160861 RepID=UPI0032E39AEB